MTIDIMSHVSFPAFMIFLRRLSVLVAAIFALAVYVVVYNFTKSEQVAIISVAIVLAIWVVSLILVLRSSKRQ